ncbi:MAG: sulfotransferase family 2 domain-containing protein [Luteolibacter sp.]|uniref:sulfotransferase family 2 domain-containing protein n=1 Tax=Luteolibacter sp. TaxID=1962973 RepID=UPI0032664271
MIISHRHKFIFLKTTKTAGTSIEIALSKFCGPDDIITPITQEDEKIRRNLGYPGPQNYLAPWWKYGIKDFITLIRKKRKKPLYYNHIPAAEVRARIGKEIWESYFKFCVERNPWDRAVSFYYWKNRAEPRAPFSEYIDSNAPVILRKNGWGVYTIDDAVVVDSICRFENLAEDLEAIRLRLSLPEKLELPRAKSRFRKNEAGYQEIYGDTEKARIEELFSDEIRRFGYEF